MSLRLPCTCDEAQEIINGILGQRHFLVSGRHLVQQARKRSFSLDEVRHVIYCGRVTGHIEAGREHGEWRCRIEGEDVEGDPLRVTVAVNEVDNQIIIITAW